MLIGKLAEMTGLSRDTIRYYESRGLIKDPVRRGNNYKDYPSEAVPRLRFVREMQELGFTLRECAEFIELFEEGQAVCGNTGPRIEAHISQIDEKIARLQSIRSRVIEMVGTCQGATAESPCSPIVDPLTRTS